jgi:hypothetical protein
VQEAQAAVLGQIVAEPALELLEYKVSIQYFQALHQLAAVQDKVKPGQVLLEALVVVGVIAQEVSQI